MSSIAAAPASGDGAAALAAAAKTGAVASAENEYGASVLEEGQLEALLPAPHPLLLLCLGIDHDSTALGSVPAKRRVLIPTIVALTARDDASEGVNPAKRFVRFSALCGALLQAAFGRA